MFPYPPTDGQTHVNALGTTYRYDSTRTAWLIVTTNIGLTGVQGDTGIQGATGLMGPGGFTGADGIQGATGSLGITGVQGPTGYQGITGLNYGATGLQGITGVFGVTGGALNFNINGNGNVLTTGIKGYLRLPYALKIDHWTIVAGETGSMVPRAMISTYNSFPSGVTMSQGDTQMFITNGIKNNANADNWGNPTGAQGDIIGIWVDSATGIKTSLVSLDFTRL